MIEEIRELPLSFEGRGEVKDYEFIQFAKSEYGYIYSVHFIGNPNELRDVHHFEVFRKKVSEGYNPSTKQTDGIFAVRYPNSNQFGITAFTVYTIERAIEILNTFKAKD